MDKAEELQAKFNALCDEQEGLYKPEFEAIFNALYSIDEGQKEIYKTIGWYMGISLPDEPDTNKIEQAIKKAGFTDEALKRGFTRYAQIVIDGKKIMQEQASTKASNVIAQKEMAVNTDEWQFVPISIIAPEPIMKDVVSPLIEADAKAGKGLFGNITDIPENDEAFDELLMIEVYGLNCTLHPFFDELIQYNIIGKDGLLKDELAKVLLSIIRGIMYFIKENTNKPNKIQNHIKEVITNFDNIPIWGLLLQILALRGLCKVIEDININEGDNGYYEAQSLYNWLSGILAEKEIQFCYVPYGNEDKQILKPLCSYLYSTDLGKMVQNTIFKNNEPQQANNGQTTGKLNLPSELDTERARKYIAKAIQAKYIIVTDKGLQWVYGGNKGQARLGYFCNKVYEAPRPVNKLEETFKVKKLSSSITNAAIEAKRADVIKWRNIIEDTIFND